MPRVRQGGAQSVGSKGFRQLRALMLHESLLKATNKK